MQALRSFLESLVLPLYFCEHPDEFFQWKDNDYRVPNMNGKKGLLKDLKTRCVLSNILAEEVSKLYDELNGYIHGAENKIINKGLFTGSHKGHVFIENDFLIWCNKLSQSIELGIKLLSVNLHQWKSHSKYLIVCTICHQSEFEITEEFFAGEMRYVYKCIKCGNEMRRGS